MRSFVTPGRSFCNIRLELEYDSVEEIQESVVAVIIPKPAGENLSKGSTARLYVGLKTTGKFYIRQRK